MFAYIHHGAVGLPRPFPIYAHAIGHGLCVHRVPWRAGQWSVSDISTGLRIANAGSRRAAVQLAWWKLRELCLERGLNTDALLETARRREPRWPQMAEHEQGQEAMDA